MSWSADGAPPESFYFPTHSQLGDRVPSLPGRNCLKRLGGNDKHLPRIHDAGGIKGAFDRELKLNLDL